MPFINWNDATPEDLSQLRVERIREEMERRGLDSAGNKDEVIQKLQAAINADRENVRAPADSSEANQQNQQAAADAPVTTLDQNATIQQMALLLQQSIN